MIGAIAGDIIGSVYEGFPIKFKEFPLFQPRCTFTDDSVLTVAVAKAILDGIGYEETIRPLALKYSNAGFGGRFIGWLYSKEPRPYNSWGNGSAMRVSPIGLAFDSVEKVLAEAAKSAEITHNHPEGVKGAQAVALAVFLARRIKDKEVIKNEIQSRFGYDLSRSIDSVRPAYCPDISCQGSVPEAIIAFLDGNSYEDAVRNAISLGGDSDTLGCITGGIAEAYYGTVSEEITEQVKQHLPDDLWEIALRFCGRFGMNND